MLVLDEADRLLEMGFKEEIMEIVKMAPKKRQTMLFRCGHCSCMYYCYLYCRAAACAPIFAQTPNVIVNSPVQVQFRFLFPCLALLLACVQAPHQTPSHSHNASRIRAMLLPAAGHPGPSSDCSAAFSVAVQRRTNIHTSLLPPVSFRCPTFSDRGKHHI